MSDSCVPIPRLPVMSWCAFDGIHRASLPCLLDQAGVDITISGRASILLAIELLGLKPGDKVLVPTYHCPTMIAPVVALDAEPIFYPINALGGPQLDWLKQQPLDGVRIILAAHYFGLPQPMQALREWCDQVGISLIEDCAHSLFGISGSRPVGQWGDIAIGSLTKFLPVPEGGCLKRNITLEPTPELSKPSVKQQFKAAVDILHVAASFRRLTGLNDLLLGAFSLRDRFRPAVSDAAQVQQLDMGQEEPLPDGFTIDATLSHRALTWASTWVARCLPRARIVDRRRRHFLELAKLLSGFNGFHPLHASLPDDSAPYVFPLWVAEPDPGYARLRKIRIPVSRWDRLWPTVPQITGDTGTLWSHHILQLACHQDLTDADIQTIANAIIQLYATNPPIADPAALIEAVLPQSRSRDAAAEHTA